MNKKLLGVILMIGILAGCGMTNEQLLVLGQTMEDVGDSLSSINRP